MEKEHAEGYDMIQTDMLHQFRESTTTPTQGAPAIPSSPPVPVRSHASIEEVDRDLVLSNIEEEGCVDEKVDLVATQADYITLNHAKSPILPTLAHTSHSPTPVAPPYPPPSTITPPNSIAPIRPIIMTVLPSKRASSQHGVYEHRWNAYLPKEITEIIAVRRRQERAWHVRLSTCASICSNIDSTLSIYKEDVERKEADRIRKYLREAIACLAASNNAPKPQKIPITSRPNKMKSSNKTNAVKQNQPLIPIPEHIICPNLQNL
ncbi:hypothetical protein EPUL_004446 [Erysiphe pulchra]|uniref:Uncharacterized protein n=1 Tax=Erysiphe pulchra TaxID=225359 RepID=A0A2S4PVY6_9PEZI|nr:hypothetical protein EPUL_004446 [Erysiphe pulchra]